MSWDRNFHLRVIIRTCWVIPKYVMLRTKKVYDIGLITICLIRNWIQNTKNFQDCVTLFGNSLWHNWTLYVA